MMSDESVLLFGRPLTDEEQAMAAKINRVFGEFGLAMAKERTLSRALHRAAIRHVVTHAELVEFFRAELLAVGRELGCVVGEVECAE